MLENIISNDDIKGIKSIIDANSSFVVLSHKNPDGDAVGSSLALCLYLRSIGKNAVVVLPNRFPDFFSWMPEADGVILFDEDNERAKSAIAEADACFCLDFNSLSRAGEAGIAAAASSSPKVMIDHHLFPSEEFAVGVSCPEACSTAELVFRVIVALGGEEAVSHEMAECIYTGMMTDTGAFAYASTRKDIYLIIASLLEKGVDKDLIYRKVFYTHSIKRMRLWGYVLYEKLRHFPKANSALITLTHKELMRFFVQKGDTEGLVNQALQIKGVRFSCFLREEVPGKINVSLRSVDDFPCNEVAAEFFNGGGHKNASGGELYCSMEDAVSLFHKALRKYGDRLTEEVKG